MTAPTVPDVTVIVTSHTGEYLDEALESLRIQTVRPREIIVVDDGSPDAVASAIADRYGFRALRNPRPTGESNARNCGLMAAQTRWVVNLDGDDVALPLFLEQLHSASLRCPFAMVVYSGAQLFGASSGRFDAVGPFDKRLIQVQNHVPANCMFDRRVGLEIGGFDVACSLFADWDFWLGFAERGHHFEYVDQDLWMYRIHHQSAIRQMDQAKFHSAYDYVRQKHGVYMKRYPFTRLLRRGRVVLKGTLQRSR